MSPIGTAGRRSRDDRTTLFAALSTELVSYRSTERGGTKDGALDSNVARRRVMQRDTRPIVRP